MKLSRRALMSAALAAPALPALAAGTPPPMPLTLDELMRRPVLLDAALSPNGEWVAVLREERADPPVAKGGDDKVRVKIIPGGAIKPNPPAPDAPPQRLSYVRLSKVTDLDGKPVQVLLGDHDAQQVEWANNDRLLVWITVEGTGERTEVNEGAVKHRRSFTTIKSRVMSIGADGKDSVLLVADAEKNFPNAWHLDKVIDLLPDDPDNVIMQIGKDYRWNLYRVNVYSGAATLLEEGNGNTDGWFLQNGVPVLRFDSNLGNTVVTVYARPPGASDWTRYRKFRRDELEKLANFDVVGATTEPGVLLVASQQPEDDAATVRRFDLKTLTLGETVAHHPDRDIVEIFQDEKSAIIGARYVEDRDSYDFTEKGLAAHFQALNSFYDNQCNLRLHDVNREHSRFVVAVSGPQQPPSFCLYDRAALHVEDLGQSRPWLTGRLAGVEVLRLKARDGLPLTAYLTVPPGLPPGPAPLVVMPHGGPQARDSYDYDPWAQAMAARGWLVLQPNFRGSGGLGRAFAEAGHHRWGDAMQWDIQDCVDALVQSGRADPARLAIMGGSYGGYAALMGTILQPDRYRCVISRAGPTDLLDFLAYIRNEDGADSPLYDWWTTLIGDPAKDEAMLKSASPLRRVTEIKVPLLLFHGDWDPIVPVAASRKMQKAMQKAGKFCAYFEVAAAGHSGWKNEAERNFLGKCGDFIAQNFR
jgi:dipeptidyl aminopeptidase/acylaminoacyl peptidase